MAYLRLEGMEFFSYHGCFHEEQLIGNLFIVDVVLRLQVDEACKQDELTKTVDYQQIYAIIEEEMKVTAKLIENVCYRIQQKIQHHFPDIIQTQVKISKMAPPLGGKMKCVSFSLES